MRIIAGKAKGRRLDAPRGPKTRPMMDRAKEAVFSALGSVDGLAVVDLFAGSGSLGLEALSRGAATAVFVESDRLALQSLRKNIDAAGLGGTVVSSDVDAFLENVGSGYDLAFVDPPYALPLPSVETVLRRLVPALAPGAVVVVHRRSRSGEVADIPGLGVADRRRYGDAEITRLIREEQA